MDWDDTIFDRGELLSHLDDLQISHYYELDELLVRTTKNTRTGNEFSFMLVCFLQRCSSIRLRQNAHPAADPRPALSAARTRSPCERGTG